MACPKCDDRRFIITGQDTSGQLLAAPCDLCQANTVNIQHRSSRSDIRVRHEIRHRSALGDLIAGVIKAPFQLLFWIIVIASCIFLMPWSWLFWWWWFSRKKNGQ